MPSKTDTALCTPGAYSLETDGEHLVCRKTPQELLTDGIQVSSELGSTKEEFRGSFFWTWVTSKFMVPLTEIQNLGEGVVFEELEYEKFGFWTLTLRYWKDIEAEISSNQQKMNGHMQG